MPSSQRNKGLVVSRKNVIIKEKLQIREIQYEQAESYNSSSIDGMSSTALHILLRPREVLWHERHFSARIVFLFSIFSLELPKLHCTYWGFFSPLPPYSSWYFWISHLGNDLDVMASTVLIAQCHVDCDSMAVLPLLLLLLYYSLLHIPGISSRPQLSSRRQGARWHHWIQDSHRVISLVFRSVV